MNPSQANKQDWRMYYSNTWMQHNKLGPGYITLDGRQFYWSRGGGAMQEIVPVSSDDLECWWPRSGSYNTPYGAVYIARKAARNMRKSAAMGDHYQVMYGRTSGDFIHLMIDGPAYVSIKEAQKAMQQKLTTSVAVARDIILAHLDNSVEVIFRGNPCGILRDTGFDAYVPDDPLSKRAYAKLMQEGIA